MFSIFFIFTKNPFLSKKIAKNQKLLCSLRKLRKLHVFCILNTLKVNCRWYKENLEHLNVSFRSFFVKYFLLYHKLENLTFISEPNIFKCIFRGHFWRENIFFFTGVLFMSYIFRFRLYIFEFVKFSQNL